MMEERQTVLRGELALLLAVVINSFGVVLMLRSGSGISAISSVPYAFSELFPRVSMGTWTYIFQGLLVLSLRVLRKRFVPEYLFSFVVGFFFGIMIDFHELWISWLPQTLPLRVLYFCISYLVHLFRHRPVQPLQNAHYPHRPVSPGAGGDHRNGLLPDQDLL